MKSLRLIQAETWISMLAITGGGLLLYYLFFYFLKRRSANTKQFLPDLLERFLKTPGLILVLVILINLNFTAIKYYLPFGILQHTRHTIKILFILSITFLVMRAISFARELLVRYHAQRNYQDYTLRSVKTKFLLTQRILNVLVIIVAVSAILMTFTQVRQVGTTLLASAGVAGIVLGFAAQKSIGTLFAGIQIAVSQPIKIDDTVIIEGTFGTVGEITLTYVVINTWDEKRLIVPINYFIEKSIVNWTRVSSEVVGKVKIYTDYTLPVEDVRRQVLSWLEESPLWDRRSASVLVTDANERAIEVRATFTAKDAGDSWDLECMIREKMIAYIRDKYPHALPTARVNIIEKT